MIQFHAEFYLQLVVVLGEVEGILVFLQDFLLIVVYEIVAVLFTALEMVVEVIVNLVLKHKLDQLFTPIFG